MRIKMFGEEGYGKGYGVYLVFCERYFDEFYQSDFLFCVKISL